MTCDDCDAELFVGAWPFCTGNPSAHVRLGGGMLGGFKEYWDEDVAPPPSDVFKPAISIPDYVEGRGYRIGNLRDRERLKKLSRCDYRN